LASRLANSHHRKASEPGGTVAEKRREEKRREEKRDKVE